MSAIAKQPVDEAYTKKIKEYTTAPFFTSPLVDYLPASKTVPTPKAVLGDVAGAPGKLPYSQEVYRYMRMVEKASPRVKVYSIGKTEEGREMIAVAVSSEANLAKLDENRARLAKLADPRTIGLNDAEADKLVDQSVPVYYITGTIHSPETGSPTALMELVYRLAVDESPYIQKIRNRIVTLITPVVEVDGRDRQVDIYRWHLANPDKNWPSTASTGASTSRTTTTATRWALTLNLTRNVLNTYIEWKAQVLHDLHESVAYLYDNTVGDGPYNAWLDPILTDEWQMIGWNNVSEMTKIGHARRLHARHVRHLDARLSDVHRRDAQRHQPAVRDVRQRRRRHARADARPERHRAHLVQAEPAAAQGEVVAAQQQQLPADGPARLAQPLRRQQEPLPQELLSEEQAVDPQAEDRRAGGVRVPWRRSAARAAGRAAAHAAAAGLRNLARDGAVHRDGARQASARRAR